MEAWRIALSSLSLILGISSSICLLVWWYKKHHSWQGGRAPLFWALALFLMYWFQIPALLSSLKKVIIVTNFNLFFVITFPLTFLALIFLYLGLLQIFKIQLERKQKYIFFIWFFSALFFFAYHFIVYKGIIETYALPLVGNIAFYIPIRGLIIFTLIRWLIMSKTKSACGVTGASFVIAESIVGLWRNFFIIKNVLFYSPSLWYMVIAYSQPLFVTQAISIILLVIGFCFLHCHCHYFCCHREPEENKE